MTSFYVNELEYRCWCHALCAFNHFAAIV